MTRRTLAVNDWVQWRGRMALVLSFRDMAGDFEGDPRLALVSLYVPASRDDRARIVQVPVAEIGA